MQEILKSIDWEIESSPIYSNGLLIPGYQAIVRNDNNICLNVAKATYTPTKNGKLVEVTEKLASMTGFEATGFSEFKQGKMVLSYLKADKATKLLGWDMEDYMVIGNSHDGTTGFFIGTSSVMLRCQNQFSKVSQNLKAFHTRNNEVRIDQLVGYFKHYEAERKAIADRMKQFSKVKIDHKIITALSERLFRMENGQEEVSARKANLLEEFNRSITQECADLGNNLHGLFNGVTHYTTHVQKTNEKVFGNIVGQAAKMNTRAFSFCEALV
jgi:hypothetical protein